jgi:hypothetical protein
MAKTISVKIKSSFFFPPDPAVFFSGLQNAITSSPSAFRNTAEALKKNVEAVIWTASMPFHLIQNAVNQRRFDRIFAAEKIRNLAVPYEKKRTLSDEEVLTLAGEKFKQESESVEGCGTSIDHIFAELEHMLQAPETSTGAREILRQSEVLVWGALEVFANDFFVVLLNTTPSLTGPLLKDERTKKRFQLKDSLSILEDFQFDMSQHMGDMLVGLHKLDDVETIRAIFDVLFPEHAPLRELLQREELWKLFQRRNLILHRRGVVDSRYLKNTGDNLQLESELTVTPDQLEVDLGLVRDISIQFLQALPPLLRRSTPAE